MKTHLLTKPEKLEEAREVFKDTSMEISVDGRRYLGGSLGTKEFTMRLSKAMVSEWKKELECLAKVATSQPQAALAAFIHGLVGKWTYAFRVAAVMSGPHLDDLERSICETLIPALTNQLAPTETVRNLLALPVRLGVEWA